MGKVNGPNRTQKGQNIVNFTDDEAREYFEKLRWPNGITCIECGSDQCYKLQGKSTRPGLIKCRACKAQFTVMVNSILQDSHLSLSQWAKAYHYMCASKKGMSALQMQRLLGLGSYKTAWHLCHRIRESMRSEPTAGLLKGDVQTDECYIGGKPRPGAPGPHRSGVTKKTPVIAMVETNGAAVVKPLPNTFTKTLTAAMVESIDPSARIVTDEKPSYLVSARKFTGGHERVNHSADQYVNDAGFTTNGAESFFALLKRGHYGTFHQMSKKHLHRYCDEFSFRWNGRKLTDIQRRDAAVMGAEGKRLMYKEPIYKKENAAGGI